MFRVGAIASVVLVVGSLTAAHGASFSAAEQAPKSGSISEDQLAHVEELRGALGLRNDRAFVLEMESREGVSRNADAGYLSLTPDEAKVVALRQALTADFAKNSGALVERAGKAWAGAQVISGDSGPVIEVLLTDDELAREADLGRAAPNYPDRVVVRTVEYSEDELEGVVHEVSALLDSEKTPHQGVRLATGKNAVEVLVDPAVGETVNRLLSGYPQVELVFVDEASRHTGLVETGLLKNQRPIYNLMYASLAIGSSTSANKCTSGFAVETLYGPFILAAAHCTNFTSGQAWYQSGMQFGTAVLFSDRADGMDTTLISTYGHRPTTGRVHIDSNNFAAVVSWLPSYLPLNSMVCHSGYGTAGMDGMSGGLGGLLDRCGVISSVCSDPPLSGTYEGCYIEANYKAAVGDSGGAVYQSSAYGYGAFGIQSTCTGAAFECLPPYRAFFTSMPRLEDDWNIVLTTWQ